MKEQLIKVIDKIILPEHPEIINAWVDVIYYKSSHETGYLVTFFLCPNFYSDGPLAEGIYRKIRLKSISLFNMLGPTKYEFIGIKVEITKM